MDRFEEKNIDSYQGQSISVRKLSFQFDTYKLRTFIFFDGKWNDHVRQKSKAC